MLGPNHAMSGFGVGLAASAIPSSVGIGTSMGTQLVFAAVVAGSALVPDWDHPSATISRAFGPVSWLIAKGLDLLSQTVYGSTKTARDSSRKGGHRTLTHTAAFALFTGGLIGLLSWLVGPNFVLGTLYVALALAFRGLAGDIARKTGWIYTNALALIGAIVVITADGAQILALGWALGLAVALGMVVHDLGDAITNSGAPLLWPLRFAGQRWYRVGLPDGFQLSTGSAVEKWIVGPGLTVVTIGTGVAVL